MGWEFPLAVAGIVVVIALLAAWTRRRRDQRRHLGELAGLPRTVTNPRLYAHLLTIRAWELHSVDPARACQWARESEGKRFPAASAIKVPIAGCGKTCHCHYQPITEQRHRQRRTATLRREDIRYDPQRDERRQARGRRREDQWQRDR